MKLAAVVLCCLLACCCSLPPPQYERSGDFAARLEWSTPGGHRVCSGVATGPHSIITAAHCVEKLTGKEAFTLNDLPSTYTVIANDGNDHIVLRVSEKLIDYTHLRHHNFYIGETLYLWGNPETIYRILRVGRVAGLNGNSTDCIDTIHKTTCSIVYFDGNLAPGDSGAAFFDEAGEVVGFDTGGYVDPSDAFVLPFFYPQTFTDAQIAEASL